MVAFRTGSDVELLDYMGDDQFIADTARVSTATERGKPYDGLIRTMVAEKHGSVFEFGAIAFQVRTPKFVRDHMVRHRAGTGFAIQSERYTRVAEDAEIWVPGDDRKLHQAGHPMAYDLRYDEHDATHLAKLALVTGGIARSATVAIQAYSDMLDNDVPREVARSVLPSGLYQDLRVQFNPRSLMHFISLRGTNDNKSHPQVETAEVADKMLKYAEEIWPTTMEYFIMYGMETP